MDRFETFYIQVLVYAKIIILKTNPRAVREYYINPCSGKILFKSFCNKYLNTLEKNIFREIDKLIVIHILEYYATTPTYY